MKNETINVDSAVSDRYSKASNDREASLCCPVNYNAQYLKAIPQEVIERDYGCGDPSEYVNEGETVLDLGSGGGKICFIASQKVGKSGKVIGVDINDDMLELAESAKPTVSENIGYSNVEFRKGKIQDLKTDRNLVDSYLKKNPVSSEADLKKLESYIDTIKVESPLVKDDSIDVVVSNCVLNLVDNSDKKVLFAEIFRTLKRGGRAVISDIVSDEAIPLHLQNDPELWSGCLSGAFVEDEFLKAFEEAGFYGIEVLKREDDPWQVVEGIEFRSVTVVAYKGKEGPCDDYKEAVIYKGPFSQVMDDDGHIIKRGERTAVCRKTFEIYKGDGYKDNFYFVEPYIEVQDKDAKPFSCLNGTVRSAKETKGEDFDKTVYNGPSSCC